MVVTASWPDWPAVSPFAIPSSAASWKKFLIAAALPVVEEENAEVAAESPGAVVRFCPLIVPAGGDTYARALQVRLDSTKW